MVNGSPYNQDDSKPTYMQLTSFKKALLLFALIATGVSFAQQEKVLNGKVSDFATFMPVESASVYVQNSTIGTVSNVDGKFSLVVPPKYVNDTLVISSIGYKSFKTAIADFDPCRRYLPGRRYSLFR